MSQTTGAASGSPSSTAATATTQNGHHPVKPRQPGEAGGDLFSSLLSLLASTGTETAAATDTPATPEASDRAVDEAPTDNPLAGLLASLPGWMPPGLSDTDPARRAGGTGRAVTEPPLARPAGADDAAAPGAEARPPLQPLEPGAARERGLEPRPERLTATEKARQAMMAAAHAAHAAPTGEARHPGRGLGTEGAPGIAWVRAGGAADTAAALVAPRSTVALDERFAAAQGMAWGTTAGREALADDEFKPGEAVGLHRSSTGVTEGSGSAGVTGAAGGAATDGGAAGDGTDGSSTGDQTRSDSQTPTLAATEDTEVTHWGAGHVRHASLRVGGEGDSAIDIRLQMQGQEVQIGFATDDARTRELLREQAPQVLGELLQRSGVELGGVSVGAQGQQAGSDRAGQPATVARSARSDRAESVATPTAMPARPRADGSHPLDVFA